jgi:hypothetical protein
MNYQYFDTPEFRHPAEQAIFVFTSDKENFKNLLDFGCGCSYEEHKWWSAELRRRYLEHHGNLDGFIPNEEQYPWDKENAKKNFVKYPLTVNTFMEKRKFCIEELKNPLPALYYEKIKSAMILEDEWNSVFIIAELDDSYIGYWWRTSA